MRKHRIAKITAVLLAFILCLACMPIAAFAAELDGEIYGPPTAGVDVRSIPGIDYNRITYKATGGTKSHPVELKLGDLTFNGELVGSHGLDIEELNEIINAVLKEKGLTTNRIALISKLAAQVEEDAKLYWLDQVIEGALSYLPSIPGMDGIGVNDIWAYVVHGEVKDFGNIQKDKILDSVVSEAEDALNDAISNGAGKVGGLIGKIDKATNAAMGATSGSKIGLGAIINTAKVAKEWSEGSKRLDKYLADLENALAEVNGFYIECSRRAQKAAEEKEGENAWVIRFDKTKNYRTYNATFWGISGVMMSAELSGVLEKVGNDDDVTGEYKGTLWLDVEAVDMTAFDIGLKSTSEIKTILDRWYSINKMPTASDTYDKTTLSRNVHGEISVTVTKSSGTENPTITGSLTSSGDETQFTMQHLYETSKHENYNHPTYKLRVEATSVDSYTAYIDRSGYSDPIGDIPAAPPWEEPTEIADFKKDKGTIWKPIESSPVMTIYFGK